MSASFLPFGMRSTAEAVLSFRLCHPPTHQVLSTKAIILAIDGQNEMQKAFPRTTILRGSLSCPY